MSFSSKNLLLTPKIKLKSNKFSQIQSPDFEKKMRTKIFNKSNVYSGFSSQRRVELADGSILPSVYRSQIYKEEEPWKNFTLKPKMAQKTSTLALDKIRAYNENRCDFLDTLNKSHTRSQSSIFGIQKSSFN